MKIKGMHELTMLRSSVPRLAPWLLVALLSACTDSAVVSQVAGSAATAGNAVIVEDPATEDQLGAEIADSSVLNEATDAALDDPDPVVPADADAAIEGTPVLRIMAVGDSITHGVGGATSYRKPLLELLQSSGCQFEMVGSMTQNLPDTGFESPHEAYSGHRTDSFLTGQVSSFGNNQGISESMLQFMPQLVLLKIGTNDISQNRDVDDVVANVDQIVALILDVEPLAQVVIATLVPFFKSADPEDAVNSRLERFSTALEAWFVQAANPAVHLIDTRDGFTAEMMLPDLIHPGETGDAFIADKFHQRIEENDLCG